MSQNVSKNKARAETTHRKLPETKSEKNWIMFQKHTQGIVYGAG